MQKSTSLPKINFSKYSNFFPKRTKPMMMDEPNEEDNQTYSQIIKNVYRGDGLEKKSYLRSRIDTFMSTKKINTLSTLATAKQKQCLMKISGELSKPLKTPQVQMNEHIAELKKAINDYHTENTLRQKAIHHTQGLLNDLKEKMFCFTPIDSKGKEDLLKERETNIIQIKFQAEILKSMHSQLKECNILHRKRAEVLREQLKASTFRANSLNQMEGDKQDELNAKEALVKDYQLRTGADLGHIKENSQAAVQSLQISDATLRLREQQEAKAYLDRADYELEISTEQHNRLLKQLRVHQFHKVILNAEWARISSKYNQLEKAERLILMSSHERQIGLRDLFHMSSLTGKSLSEAISKKEEELQELGVKHKKLVQECGVMEEGQPEYRLQTEKWANKLKQRTFMRDFHRKDQEIESKLELLLRLKKWILEKEGVMGVKVSRKKSPTDHLIALIQEVRNQSRIIGEFQPTQQLSANTKPMPLTHNRKK